MLHVLKTWPEYFEPIENGAKTFEIRAADRPFAAGDVLQLREYSPDSGTYTGRQCAARVTYVLKDGPFAFPGYVVMSILVSR